MARARECWKVSHVNHPSRLMAAWVPSLAENIIFFIYTKPESYCTWLCVAVFLDCVPFTL